MSTVLERFYEDALSRVAIQKPISDEDLPRPNYPQHEGFDPATAATDNDYVFPIGQKWLVENVKTRMSLDRATTTLLNNQDRNLKSSPKSSVKCLSDVFVCL